MTALSHEYIHAPCEIKTLSNEPLLTGYVERITDEYVEIVNTYDKMPLIPCNTYVKLSVYSSTEQFRVLIGCVYLSTDEFIRILDIKSLAEFEKRNFFRVTFHAETEAYLMGPDGRKVPDTTWFPISVYDISLSGIYFESRQNLVTTDKITVSLKVYNNPILLPCSVTRRTAKSEANLWGYGCEFLENTGRQFDLLCRYIFELQREEIQRIRQKRER